MLMPLALLIEAMAAAHGTASDIITSVVTRVRVQTTRPRPSPPPLTLLPLLTCPRKTTASAMHP